MSSSATMDSAAADHSAEVRDMVQQSVETALGRLYSFEQRAQAHASPAAESAEAWEAYSALGICGLGLDEEIAGFATNIADLAMVVELLGTALTLEPYRPTMVAARLIAATGSTDQRDAWLPRIVAGDVRAAIAFPAGGFADPPPVTAHRDGAAWRLEGRVPVVVGGDTADIFVVPAIADETVALFLVPADPINRKAYRCFDWTGAADLDFANVRLADGARLDGGTVDLAAALDEDTALACADALGAIRAANRLIRDHTRNRRQFGRSLDSFQVLQHRMVDMAIEEEIAASLTKAAVTACESADPGERARAVSTAKVRVGDAARFVGEQCVQTHGGMGLVQEYPASHIFARLGLFEVRNGDRDYHLQRFAGLAL